MIFRQKTPARRDFAALSGRQKVRPGLQRLGNCAKRYMDQRGEQLERGTRVVGELGDAIPEPLQGECEAAELSGGTLRLKVKPGTERWLAEVEKREMAARLAGTGVREIKLCV